MKLKIIAQKNMSCKTIISFPSSVSDPDLVGSRIICRIRIRNLNFGSESGSEKDPKRIRKKKKLNFLLYNNVNLRKIYRFASQKTFEYLKIGENSTAVLLFITSK